MLFRLLTIILCSAAVMFSACAGERKPATPLETFKTYAKAVKQKDTTTMKLLLSDETMKMHEQEARSQSVTVDDIVTRDTLFSADQKTVEFRNERVDGERATIEVKNSFGTWETVPFVFEDDQWKIDKKGYADRLMQDIEQQNQQLQEQMNQDRIPDPAATPSF